MRLFIATVLLSFSAFAQEYPPTVIRTKRCIARNTSCRYTNQYENRTPGTTNSCSLVYSYVTQEKITIVKPNGEIVVLPEPEEKIVTKTFEKTFYYNVLMDARAWYSQCEAPCLNEIAEQKLLIGECKV